MPIYLMILALDGKNLIKKKQQQQWTKFVASSLPPHSSSGITWCWHFKKRKSIQWMLIWCRESEMWKFRFPQKEEVYRPLTGKDPPTPPRPQFHILHKQ